MATAPVKSPLHNFPLSLLKWGSTSSVNPHHRFRRPLDSLPPDSDPNRPPDSDPADDQAHRQWNLRPRRSAPSEIGAFAHPRSAEFLTESETAPKSSRLRGLADGGAEKREKQKLWVALSKEEIEEDIYSLTGSKPSRRPRKRPKNVQKHLETIFPGQWLVGISPEAYRKEVDIRSYG